MKPYLSKSKLISAWQCSKKVHLEKHHSEFGIVTPQMESLFAGGHSVGDIAKQLYGTKDSVEIEFNVRTMLRETKMLIEQGVDFPIFEATFRHEGVLIRADVMIPAGNGWHVVEVKASTSLKDHHQIDCAIQDWVLRNSGINVLTMSLAHINNQFVYGGDGDYEGLLLEHDLTEDVRSREAEVLELVALARDAVGGSMPLTAVGAHCTNPFECQFMNYCWPMDAEYPVIGLRGNKAKLGTWVAAGCRDIRDVDSSEITADTQRRIHRVTRAGEPEVLTGAAEILEALAFPRYYLDFETVGPPVPIWAGTRPYQAIPIQWSCHIEDSGGELRHLEFLDLSGKPPMRALAEELINCLGDDGPVLMYTPYERTVLKQLIELYPDLNDPLNKIIDRLFDLQPVVKAHYYHPRMLGSWSIKAVLPCVAPHMNYAQLDGINEGTAASDAFLEAISPETSEERKVEIEQQLRRYCRFDTEAMVEVVRFFTNGTNVGLQ